MAEMDEKFAQDLFEDFQYNAHSLDMIGEYQDAARLLYGDSWAVVIDDFGRMQFRCEDCQKNVNDTTGVANHSRSKKHVKVLDQQQFDNYDESMSIRELIESSVVKPLGLQMIEEYSSGQKLYYKCILCGAHSSKGAMYHHIMGIKHTDRYILKYTKMTKQQFSLQEREHWCNTILSDEGLRLQDILTIEGRQQGQTSRVAPDRKKLFGDIMQVKRNRNLREVHEDSSRNNVYAPPPRRLLDESFLRKELPRPTVVEKDDLLEKLRLSLHRTGQEKDYLSEDESSEESLQSIIQQNFEKVEEILNKFKE